MSKSSIQAICSVLLILAFVIIIDLLVGMVGRIAFKNLPDNQTELSRLNYGIAKTTADCIILGSSHASHHYNPVIISDSLNMTVYNAGEEGYGLTYSLALFKALLSRYTPKMVILDIKYEESEEWISRVRDLKPYFKEYPTAFETDVMINGNREHFRLLWNSYMYNSTLLRLLKSYITGNKSSSYRLDGYNPIPVKGNRTCAVRNQEVPAIAANPKYKDCLSELSLLCKQNGIALFAVSSPTLVKLKYESPAIPIINSLEITYLDHFNDDFFLAHTELFRDEDHMFETGADIFSEKISNEINRIINNRNIK